MYMVYLNKETFYLLFLSKPCLYMTPSIDRLVKCQSYLPVHSAVVTDHDDQIVTLVVDLFSAVTVYIVCCIHTFTLIWYRLKVPKIL